jgi:hypothetical protein
MFMSMFMNDFGLAVFNGPPSPFFLRIVSRWFTALKKPYLSATF